MKFSYFILATSIVFIYFVAIEANQHHDEKPGDIIPEEHQAVDKCHEQFKLNVDENAYRLMEKDSPKTKCFAKCIYDKMGYGKNDEKPVDYEGLSAKMKKDYEKEAKVFLYAANNVDKCKEAAKHGADECEKAHNYVKCDLKTLNEDSKAA